MASTNPCPRLGIALGGGAARGWAHIGVLSALAQHGIEPEIVCGTSIGALVGGIYAAGRLQELEAWVGQLTRRDVIGLLDFTASGGGAIGGRKLMDFFGRDLGELTIEQLPRKYAAVATDLRTGTEVWLQVGPLLRAIRASISLPGMFTPVFQDGRWLVDGGLVNPTPVSLCRALGAELVIAVDLHGAATLRREEQPELENPPSVVQVRTGRSRLSRIFSRHRKEDAAGAESEAEEEHAGNGKPTPPGVAAVIATSLDIMQARLSRSRLAGDPPDLLLSPRVRQVAPLEFAGGRPTIDEGYENVRRMLPALKDLLGID